jgi:hypothetical protein
MFDLDGREEVLWVMVERGVWRQHVSTVFLSTSRILFCSIFLGRCYMS